MENKLNIGKIEQFMNYRRQGFIFDLTEGNGKLIRDCPERLKDIIKAFVQQWFGRIISMTEKVYGLILRRPNTEPITVWLPNKEREHIDKKYRNTIQYVKKGNSRKSAKRVGNTMVTKSPMIKSTVGASNGQTIWYHGTYVKEVESVQDLRTEFASKYGDFGKGVYLTLEKQMATKFADNRGPFKAVWCNGALDVVCQRLFCGEEYFEDVIIGAGEHEYKILVITKVGEKWREVMLDGWVKGLQQKNFDMVLGPVGAGNAKIISQKVRNKKASEEEFKSSIKALTGYPNIVFELCVYKDEIIQNCFVKIP